MHGEVPVIWFWLCFHPNIAAVFSHKFVNEDVCKIGSKSIYWRMSGVWKGYRRARHGMESFIIRDYYFLCFSFFLSLSWRHCINLEHRLGSHFHDFRGIPLWTGTFGSRSESSSTGFRGQHSCFCYVPWHPARLMYHNIVITAQERSWSVYTSVSSLWLIEVTLQSEPQFRDRNICNLVINRPLRFSLKTIIHTALILLLQTPKLQI